MSTTPDYSKENLQRLMAAQGLSIAAVARQTGLDRRTVHAILLGTAKPHARTLNRLAEGLQVATDELFLDPSRLLYRRFDRHSNPVVQEVIESHRELFCRWTEADFDELHSRVGAGGALTAEGTLAAVRQMNRKRELFEKLDLLLETSQADVVARIVELFYEQATAQPA